MINLTEKVRQRPQQLFAIPVLYDFRGEGLIKISLYVFNRACTGTGVPEVYWILGLMEGGSSR